MSTGTVAVLAGGPVSQERTGRYEAVLGRHIRVNPQPIAARCLRGLVSVSQDAATVAEAVALADRLLTRHRADAWARRIRLQVPVYEVSSFNDDVVEKLVDALQFLTGDSWQFDFVARDGINWQEEYLPLGGDAVSWIVPFSNGLDSFAQARLLEHQYGADHVLRVRSGVLQAGREKAPLVSVPRRFFVGHPRELTYRTRPFVYYSMAAIAAATSGATQIAVGESGQGALGPSFATFANEWPFRSAHPGFLERLGRYASHLFKKEISFIQPHLWRTKGQVLLELKELGILDGWADTVSCSARPMQRHGHSGCGVCGGCLLRTLALHAADLPPETQAFDVKSEGLVGTAADGTSFALPDNSIQILTRAALSMKLFAGVEDSYREVDLERQLVDVPADAASARKSLREIIARHAMEWGSFLNELPNGSWLRRQFQS